MDLYVYPGAVELKSYVITSKLPADVYSKYVEDKGNSAHITGFTFAVIGIVHLAGGKISEGNINTGFYLILLFF